jgi:hypothetical protein
MSMQMLESMLLWCFVLNFGFLLYWWLMFMWLHDFVYRLHMRWFKMSREQFDGIHYGAMAFYKLAVIVFNFMPWLALKIVA